MEVSLVSQNQQFGCIAFRTTEICSLGTLSFISFSFFIQVVRRSSSLIATANHKSIKTEKINLSGAPDEQYTDNLADRRAEELLGRAFGFCYVVIEVVTPSLFRLRRKGVRVSLVC